MKPENENKDLVPAQITEISKVLFLDTKSNHLIQNVVKIEHEPSAGLLVLSLGHTGIQIRAKLQGFGTLRQEDVTSLVYLLEVAEPDVSKFAYALLEQPKKAHAEMQASKQTEEKVELKEVEIPKQKPTKKAIKVTKKKKK